VLSLRPSDAQAMADLADALAMSQQRSFAGEPTRLIAAALKADPDNLKALALAGTLAFESGDKAGAERHWRRLVQLGPADSGLTRQARDGLAELGAKSEASVPGGPATPAAADSAISGRVTLAPALAAETQPDDTVFVFARPASGAKMPLAILKKRVRDLPLDFTLDDSLAMSPAAKLSGASMVVVGARISRSGQAMPQPGDLQGLSASLAPGARGLQLQISAVLP
ncbi:tetratricopeptide repeat protein, partial [Ideonella sp.]|uniref:tetratricopeptide repeat protein n=1 Tax=Ideonella sp. TaxID=1929293 RepID=UPI003BB81091